MRWTTESEHRAPIERVNQGPSLRRPEDLTNGYPLLDKLPVDHPDHLCLILIYDQVPRDAIPFGDVAVSVGRPAADEASLARFLELAALPKQHPLVLDDRLLCLEQELVKELVIRVIGDGVIDGHDL